MCAGCHSANYDPTKVNAAGGVITTASPLPAQDLGNEAYSETDIGCSSCHYGAINALPNSGADPNDTAHTASYGALANAEICGACHSRFSYTVGTYSSKVVNGSTLGLVQPQMAIGYPMIGASYAPLSNYLNVSQPGWTPTPTATTTGFPNLQTYWVVDGVTTPWQQSGHDGSAAQYPEWLSSGHANSLAALKAVMGPNPPATCLQCHSADYRIAAANGGPVPTGSETKYGITCVGCHTPHQAGTAKGTWSSDFDTQLVGNPKNPSDLCTTCHTAQLNGGVALAGATIHNDQNEVMDGTGAIGVPQGLPGAHKGKCVQCHMAPTSYSRGAAQLGGNHTMDIITPQDAVDATPVPISTATSTAVASGVTTTTLTITQGSMPYSACSTCHNNNVTATPQPVSTTTVVVNATHTTKTILQNQAGGDQGLWLQNTIDQRQAAMKAKYASVAADLHAAGLRMGYQKTFTSNATGTADEQYAAWLNGQLNTKGSAKWTANELTWQKAYTNWTYVGAEGSWGIHNYQYDSLVITAAETFANQVAKAPQTLTLKLSKTSVTRNATVTFSGTVSPATAGTVQIQKSANDIYGNWRSAKPSGGKYSITVKMTSAGTFHYRAFLAPSQSYAGGTSGAVRLTVK